MKFWGYILVGVAFYSFQVKAQSDVKISFDQLNHEVKVVGISQFKLHQLKDKSPKLNDWQQLYAIYVLDKKSKQPISTIPVLGTYLIKDEYIVFSPRLPFDRNLKYLAKFNVAYLHSVTGTTIPNPIAQQIRQFVFEIDRAKIHPPTRVTSIYPSADTLPVNQLKFYINFSQPIKLGQIYDNVFFENEDGHTIKDAFLRLNPELWDEEHKRVTLWLDPGRIKRELSPHLLQGLPLQTGQSYKLVIRKTLKDVYDNPINDRYFKSFVVVEDDRIKPKINKWHIVSPAKSGSDTLALIFDEALDEALLHHMIRVEDKGGHEVLGEISIVNKGRTWRFVPKNPWNHSRYFIVINSKLEDLAGNSLRRLFDTEIISQNTFVPSSLIYTPIRIQKTTKQKKIRKWHSRISNQ